MIKHSTIEMNVIKNPVFIVGQCPGRPKKSDISPKVWQGNRAGKVMQEIVKDFENLYLTNIMNYYVKGKIQKDQLETGISELVDDIEKFRPKSIVCFGDFAYKQIIDVTPINAFKVIHPSYVLRFKLNKEEYIKMCRQTIKEALEWKTTKS